MSKEFTSEWLIRRQLATDAKAGKAAPAPSKSAVLESKLHEEIAAYLKSLGHACYFVHSRMDRPHTNAVGTPDFYGHWNGNPFALEVKRPGQKETREQAGEILRVRLAGGTGEIVHSLEEAIQALAFIEFSVSKKASGK